MTTTSLNKITTKTFLGIYISSEMRMHLNQSITWKHAVITPLQKKSFKEVHCQGKDYIGFYLEKNITTLQELTSAQEELKEQIKIYCPEIEVENQKICIFPQVFVA
jgi:hypothetical protein